MRAKLIFAAIILCLACGCTRTAVVQKYYLLEIPAALENDQPPAEPRFDRSCEIMAIELAPPFASNRIALRVRSHELTYYAYHKWAVRPDEILTPMVEQYLQNQGIFATVSRRLWELNPHYRLQTRINRLEVIQDEKDLAARLDLEFIFIDNASKRVLTYHAASKTKALEQKNLNLFAAAISELFHEEMQILAQKMIDALESAKTTNQSPSK